jgi:hypothetical protein
MGHENEHHQHEKHDEHHHHHEPHEEHHGHHEHHKPHEIEYFVDDEPQRTTEKVLTPTQILTKAGIDPASHYLVQIKIHDGHKEQISYKDKPNEEILMHECMKFVSNSKVPTPVS